MLIFKSENTIAVFTSEIAGIIVYTINDWTFADVIARISENEFSRHRPGDCSASPNDLSVIDWTIYQSDVWQMQEIPVNEFFAKNKIYDVNQYGEIIF